MQKIQICNFEKYYLKMIMYIKLILLTNGLKNSLDYKL